MLDDDCPPIQLTLADVQQTSVAAWAIVSASDSGPGVYAIWQSGELIYVGHTSECWKRIRDHERSGMITADARVGWRSMRCQVEARLLEYAIIGALQPRLNIHAKGWRAFRFVEHFCDVTLRVRLRARMTGMAP